MKSFKYLVQELFKSKNFPMATEKQKETNTELK